MVAPKPLKTLFPEEDSKGTHHPSPTASSISGGAQQQQ